MRKQKQTIYLTTISMKEILHDYSTFPSLDVVQSMFCLLPLQIIVIISNSSCPTLGNKKDCGELTLAGYQVPPKLVYQSLFPQDRRKKIIWEKTFWIKKKAV